MTEKRFELGVDEQYGAILDNGKIMRKGEIVELLNELHEENIEYKRELDNIYLLIGRGDWSGLVDLLICDEKSKTE